MAFPFLLDQCWGLGVSKEPYHVQGGHPTLRSPSGTSSRHSSPHQLAMLPLIFQSSSCRCVLVSPGSFNVSFPKEERPEGLLLPLFALWERCASALPLEPTGPRASGPGPALWKLAPRQLPQTVRAGGSSVPFCRRGKHSWWSLATQRGGDAVLASSAQECHSRPSCMGSSAQEGAQCQAVFSASASKTEQCPGRSVSGSCVRQGHSAAVQTRRPREASGFRGCSWL